MMGDIYAAASATVIWLGEESSDVKMAFGWLRRFALAWSIPESGLDLITKSRAEGPLQAAFGRHRATAFRHLWALLDRQWFTRKWVIQELVKSQRPMLMVGRL